MPEIRMIPISELREPAHAVRAEISDDGLASLITSIRELGILEPLIVRPRDGIFFEVVAGHRRLLAARQAPLAEVPCIIEADDERADAIKIHENLEREELNPAEEGVFYAELYEKLGQDVDRVAERVRKSRNYVEARLNLVRGDQAVFKVLTEGKITLGVAQELNQFTRDNDRSFHLDYGVRTGANVRTMRDWRMKANERADLFMGVTGQGGSGEVESTPPIAPPQLGPKYVGMAKPYELSTSTEIRECLFCQAPHEEWKMYKKHVCAPCADRILTKPTEELAR